LPIRRRTQLLGSRGARVLHGHTERCWRLTDHPSARKASTQDVCHHALNRRGRPGPPRLGDYHTARTPLSPHVAWCLACCRLYPLPGAHHTSSRAPRLDAGVILSGHGGAQRPQDLAPEGARCAGSRDRRGNLALGSPLRARYVVAVAPFPKACDHIQPTGRTTPSPGLLLGWTVAHGTLGTRGSPTFQHRAHHVDGLIASHAPARLVSALVPGVMTGRACVPLRGQVQRRAFTTIPWGAHEGGPVFDLRIPRAHGPSTPPPIRLHIKALSEFYNGSFFSASRSPGC
jgi:hypothetical protein